MRFWRRNMPGGMLLRSGREWHLDAAGVHTFDAFVGEPVDPIPVETFIAYADWFVERKGVVVREARVNTLTEGERGASPAGGRTARRSLADRVVAAPGIAHFAVEPAEIVGRLAP